MICRTPLLLPLLLVLGAPAWLPAQTPETLIANGHFKRARALLTERLRTDPNNPETLWLASWVKQAWKDNDAAIQFAEKAVAADSRSSRYHMRLADALSEEAIHASKLRQLGLAKRIKKEIDTALSLDPKNVEAMRWLMEFYLQAPGIFGGDKTKARAIPGQMMQVDPVEGYFAQIQLARYDKQTGGFEALYRKAVEARPGSFDAQIRLAGFCTGSSPARFDEAETHAREALRINSDRIEGHRMLAAVLVHLGKWAELDRALADAEKLVPDNLSPFLVAAINLTNLNQDLPRGERYLRQYLTQEPEPNMASHAEAHWRLGRLLEKGNRKPEAVAEYQTAVQMGSNSPAKQDLKRLK